MGVSNYSQELYSNGLINELTDGLVNVYVEAEVVKCIPDLMQYLPEYWHRITSYNVCYTKLLRYKDLAALTGMLMTWWKKQKTDRGGR